jgi:hypothetical protein
MFLANLFDISFSDGKPCHITFLRLSDIGGPITARKTWICIKRKKKIIYTSLTERLNNGVWQISNQYNS